MQKGIFGLAVVLLMTACDHDEAPVRDGRDFCQNDGDCVTEIHTNSEIHVEDYFGQPSITLVAGEKLVFEYRFEYHDNPTYTDDERVEFLYFQVDAGTDSFDYDSLPAATVYYRKSCGECLALDQEVAQGSLEGMKLSDTQWHIKADLVISHGPIVPGREVIADAVFTKP